MEGKNNQFYKVKMPLKKRNIVVYGSETEIVFHPFGHTRIASLRTEGLNFFHREELVFSLTFTDEEALKNQIVEVLTFLRELVTQSEKERFSEQSIVECRKLLSVFDGVMFVRQNLPDGMVSCKHEIPFLNVIGYLKEEYNEIIQPSSTYRMKAILGKLGSCYPTIPFNFMNEDMLSRRRKVYQFTLYDKIDPFFKNACFFKTPRTSMVRIVKARSKVLFQMSVNNLYFLRRYIQEVEDSNVDHIVFWVTGCYYLCSLLIYLKEGRETGIWSQEGHSKTIDNVGGSFFAVKKMEHPVSQNSLGGFHDNRQKWNCDVLADGVQVEVDHSLWRTVLDDLKNGRGFTLDKGEESCIVVHALDTNPELNTTQFVRREFLNPRKKTTTTKKPIMVDEDEEEEEEESSNSSGNGSSVVEVQFMTPQAPTLYIRSPSSSSSSEDQMKFMNWKWHGDVDGENITYEVLPDIQVMKDRLKKEEEDEFVDSIVQMVQEFYTKLQELEEDGQNDNNKETFVDDDLSTLAMKKKKKKSSTAYFFEVGETSTLAVNLFLQVSVSEEGSVSFSVPVKKMEHEHIELVKFLDKKIMKILDEKIVSLDDENEEEEEEEEDSSFNLFLPGPEFHILLSFGTGNLS